MSINQEAGTFNQEAGTLKQKISEAVENGAGEAAIVRAARKLAEARSFQSDPHTPGEILDDYLKPVPVPDDLG